MPPWERASVAAVRFPARLSVKVTPRAVCLGVEGLDGVTQRMKGSMASRALKSVEGIDRGRVERKGRRSEGVEECNELATVS